MRLRPNVHGGNLVLRLALESVYSTERKRAQMCVVSKAIRDTIGKVDAPIYANLVQDLINEVAEHRENGTKVDIIILGSANRRINVTVDSNGKTRVFLSTRRIILTRYPDLLKKKIYETIERNPVHGFTLETTLTEAV